MAADFYILCYISFFQPDFVISFDFLLFLCNLTVDFPLLPINMLHLPKFTLP